MHGRDFKPAADELMDISTAALRAGLERDYPGCAPIFDSVRRDIAYYGDLSNDYLVSLGRRYDAGLDAADRRNALAALRQIATRKKFGILEYDRLPGKSAIAEFLVGICAPVFGAFGLWGWLCARKAPDVSRYLRHDSAYSVECRRRVREKLVQMLSAGDQVMLISHGTGSAIAWDALWELSHDPQFSELADGAKVDLWLTLGAPLGDRHCRRRLFGAREKGDRQYPTNVIAWYNVAAEDDYTCHDNTVADDFRKMLRERAISAVHDYVVYNHAVRYGKSNPHSSVGYYIHPRVSKIIADWLRPEGHAETDASPSPDSPRLSPD